MVMLPSRSTVALDIQNSLFTCTAYPNKCKLMVPVYAERLSNYLMFELLNLLMLLR